MEAYQAPPSLGFSRHQNACPPENLFPQLSDAHFARFQSRIRQTGRLGEGWLGSWAVSPPRFLTTRVRDPTGTCITDECFDHLTPQFSGFNHEDLSTCYSSHTGQVLSIFEPQCFSATLKANEPMASHHGSKGRGCVCLLRTLYPQRKPETEPSLGQGEMPLSFPNDLLCP